MRKIFHSLVDPDEVIRILEGYVNLKPREAEVVGIEEAYGRVLAEDVYAVWDAPPFDRSEVDGYAVASESVAGAEEDSPVELRVKGYVRIGEVPDVSVDIGTAAEIDTGAMLPRGADSVVMVEHTKRVGDRLLVFKSVTSGENVARAGSDIARGELLLRKGTLLGPAEVAALAATGVGSVKVFRRVSAGILSIGNELRAPRSTLGGAQVFDVNSYSIAASLRELGCVVRRYGIVRDSEGEIREALIRALREDDIVFTSGGTSAGTGDLTYRVLDSLGSPGVVVHGVKIRPGKPTVVAVINGKVIIGLPGFPLSALMAFRRVAIPIVARLAGLRSHRMLFPEVDAELSERILGSRGRATLAPVALIKRGDKILAYPVSFRSGSVYLLTYADGFIEVPANTSVVERGANVKVLLFRRWWVPPALVCIGSHDYLLSELLNKVLTGREFKSVPAGSLGGILAVAAGEADIGGTHLIDERSGEYNIPVIRRLGLESKVRLVRGWGREVGLVVRKGNPKHIKSFDDLLRDDVMFVNRNKGSGTRALIDSELRKLAKARGNSFENVKRSIRGYWNEVRTHTAVAVSVSQGRADVGVAVKWAAKLYDLDFIKLGEEVFDLVINSESFRVNSHVKRVIDALRPGGVLDELLKRFEGYFRLPDTGKIIL